MTISILMPVYNAAPYLQACLQSILEQHSTNWELLAVDDFSTDGSLQILQRYAADDARIQVFQNTDKGIISALRLAFAQARGSVITRMDADDKMAPDKLGQLLALLQARGPGHLAVGLVSYFSAAPLGDGYRQYADWLNGLCQSDRHYEEIYRECVIPSPCWMVYREDLLHCDAFEPTRYPEDYDLCFRFYRQQLKVCSVQSVLHFWRDHPDRASRNDPHYAQNQFFELKVSYFKTLDYNPARPLVLWGAGKKGKQLARLLRQAELPFYWICNTASKWGQWIEGVQLQPSTQLEDYPDAQVLIAVSAPDGRNEILNILSRRQRRAGSDYFLFC